MQQKYFCSPTIWLSQTHRRHFMKTTNLLQKKVHARGQQGRWCLARAVNGISINGDEYLLDDNNEIKFFNTPLEAYAFIYNNVCISLAFSTRTDDSLTNPKEYEEDPYHEEIFFLLADELGIYLKTERDIKDNEH
jgi:hypothetical protein